MREWFVSADDMKAVARACSAVIDAHLSRSPQSEGGTLRELDALRNLRNTLEVIDREKVEA